MYDREACRWLVLSGFEVRGPNGSVLLGIIGKILADVAPNSQRSLPRNLQLGLAVTHFSERGGRYVCSV